MHEDGRVRLAELAQELAAHAARAAEVVHVGRDRDGLEAAHPVPLHHGGAHGDPLRARPDGVRGVFDVGARDDGAGWGGGFEEQGAADAEEGVGAFAGMLATWPLE
jgi:hypothetical protein